VKWLSSLFTKVWGLVSLPARWVRSRWFQPKPEPVRFIRVDEMPDRLKSWTVYLCGEGEHLWAAALICPCGCGEVIQLNLLQQARPCWNAVEHPDGTVSLAPSVWRQKGCGSHFFIRHGRVDWC
jgi:hypothetical protein